MEREHSSGDGDQPRESLPKQLERERSHHPTSVQSSEVGESLPKSSFNPDSCEDGVSVCNIEASACTEKKRIIDNNNIIAFDCNCIQKAW